MKMVHSNIVLVEEADTPEAIQNWIVEHTDVIVVNLNHETWIHAVTPGDLLIFDSSFAMFRFPARVVKE